MTDESGYIVISGEVLATFSQQVSAQIQQGWLLHGPTLVVPAHGWKDAHGIEYSIPTTFYQALFKRVGRRSGAGHVS